MLEWISAGHDIRTRLTRAPRLAGLDARAAGMSLKRVADAVPQD
jgi:hypothetical protein